MRQRKLSQLLLLFNDADQRGFQTFLINPFFNHSKVLVAFFDLFKKNLLDQPEEVDCTPEEFLQGSGINPDRMDKLCSQLYALACTFLSVRTFLKKDQVKHEMLVEAVEELGQNGREVDRLYQKMQSGIESQQDSPEKIMQSLKLRWKLAEVAIKSRDTRALWQEDFRELHSLLSHYYQLQKLRLLAASANARNIFNHSPEEVENELQEDHLEELDQMAFDSLSRAYVLTITMFRSEQGAPRFVELLELLKEKAHRFAPEEGMELYGYALNFCIWNSNQGNLEYLPHASSLYIQLLDNKLILDNGEILPPQFKNIVALHCRLGKIEWVRRFIDQYGAFLPPENRAFALLYNEAILAFYQQDYPSAILGFKEVIATLSDDIFYGLDARAYLWKSYFEHFSQLTMAEVDEMQRLYDAFRLFIERNEKISTAHKLLYRNFIRASKRYLEILQTEPIRTEDLQELRSNVSTLEFVSDKGWFLDKIEISLAGLGAR